MSADSGRAPAGPRPGALGGLLRHALVYSLVPIVQRLLGFALIPLFTDRLNPAQWGVSELTDILIVAATQAAGTNLLAGMARFYFDHREQRDRDEVVSSAIVSLTALAWAVATVGILLRDDLARWLFDPGDPKLAGDDLALCMAIALATIPLSLTSEAGFRYLQIQRKSTRYTLVRSTKTLLELALKVYFVVGLEWGIAGFLGSVLVGEFLTATLLTGGIVARIGPRVSFDKLAPMARYALPLIPVGLLQMGLHQLDRAMLKWLGPEELRMTWVGVYGLGYKLGFMVQSLGVGAFMQAWQPSIFEIADPAERRRLQARVDAYAMIAIGAASSGLILFGRELVFVLAGSAEYQDAHQVVPWVAAAYVFYGLYALTQVTLLAEKRTLPLLWVNVVGLAVKLGLCWLLIAPLAFVGPAIATLVAFAAMAAACAWVAHGARAEGGGVHVERKRIGAVLASVLGALTLVVAFERGAGELAWGAPQALKALAFCAILAFLWAGVLRREERAQLVARLRRRR